MPHIISSSALYEVISRKSNNNGSDFTIKSVKTGKDYTYKISRSCYNGVWYTHVKVELEYQNFVRLGTYINGAIRHKGIVVNTPSAIAIAYVLKRTEDKDFANLDKLVEVMHTGNCLICGKILTDAKSIEIGLGPVCRVGN